MACEQVESVNRTLSDIGAGDRPIVLVLNKIDLLDSGGIPAVLCSMLPDAVQISALSGANLAELLAAVERVLGARLVHLDVTIPYSEGRLLGAVHEMGRIEHQEHTGQGTRVVGWFPKTLAGQVGAVLAAVPTSEPLA